MPNILLVDLKTITRSKEQHPITELDYELLDEKFNPIGNEERILINPQIKSRTYKDGMVTHPKGEGVNKNYPNFKERYSEICSLIKEKGTIVMFYSEVSLPILGESSRRYNVKPENFKFSCLIDILSDYEKDLYKNSLVKTYRKIMEKSRKEPLPSNIKMMEEILKWVRHRYDIDLTQLYISETTTTENYSEFLSIVEHQEYDVPTKESKCDA